jgi:hypothetical protein
LPLFYWRFLHRCSLRRLACSSPFWLCPCLVLEGTRQGFIEWIRQHSLLFHFMEKFKKYCY